MRPSENGLRACGLRRREARGACQETTGDLGDHVDDDEAQRHREPLETLALAFIVIVGHVALSFRVVRLPR